MLHWFLLLKNTVLSIAFSIILTIFGAGTICLFKLLKIHFVALIMIPIICMSQKSYLLHEQMETWFAMIWDLK